MHSEHRDNQGNKPAEQPHHQAEPDLHKGSLQRVEPALHRVEPPLHRVELRVHRVEPAIRLRLAGLEVLQLLIDRDEALVRAGEPHVDVLGAPPDPRVECADLGVKRVDFPVQHVDFVVGPGHRVHGTNVDEKLQQVVRKNSFQLRAAYAANGSRAISAARSATELSTWSGSRARSTVRTRTSHSELRIRRSPETTLGSLA